MNKQNITPNPKQPIERVPTGKLPSAFTTGKLPSALAELEEANLSSTHTLPLWECIPCACSYDGEE